MIPNSRSEWGFETRAIHAGQAPDAASGAVVTPITLSTTFAQDGVGDHKGFEYSRSGNPTRAALETCVASLEAARHGLAFASGLAAEDNVLRLLTPGDRILLGNDAYGGTFRLISKIYGPLGYPWTAVDLTDLDGLVANWQRRHPPGLAGNAHESAADLLRYRGDRRDRPRAGRDRRRRQHLRHAVPAATAAARRRHRRPLGDQVPRWPLRCRRGVSGPRRRRAGRPTAVHPERRRRHPGTVRLLHGAARRQDARSADGTALLAMPEPSSICCSGIRPSIGCSIPNSPIIPAMPPRPARCATSAEWSASPCAAERRRR